jgi:hypothetical protein
MLNDFSQTLVSITSMPLIKTFSVSIQDGQPILELITLYNTTEANRVHIKPYRETDTYQMEMFRRSYPTRSFKKMTVKDIQATLRLYCLPKI